MYSGIKFGSFKATKYFFEISGLTALINHGPETKMNGDIYKL